MLTTKLFGKSATKNGLCAAGLFLLGMQQAWATSVTFNSFVTTTDNPVIDTAPSVELNDSTAGFLTFTVTAPNSNGELSAIYVDLTGDPSYNGYNLSSQTTGVQITDFQENTRDIGNGRSLNGGFGSPINSDAGLFDFGFGFDDGENGGNARRIDLPFIFQMADLGTFTINNIDRIGLRFQSVGELGEDGLGGGSEKLISLGPGPLPAPVPLPAAAWFFLSGLGVLGWVKKQKRS